MKSLKVIGLYTYEDDENPLEILERLLQCSLNHEKVAFKKKIQDYTQKILNKLSSRECRAFEKYKIESNYHSFDSYPFDEKERILEFLAKNSLGFSHFVTSQIVIFQLSD